MRHPKRSGGRRLRGRSRRADGRRRRTRRSRPSRRRNGDPALLWPPPLSLTLLPAPSLPPCRPLRAGIHGGVQRELQPRGGAARSHKAGGQIPRRQERAGRAGQGGRVGSASRRPCLASSVRWLVGLARLAGSASSFWLRWTVVACWTAGALLCCRSCCGQINRECSPSSPLLARFAFLLFIYFFRGFFSLFNYLFIN